jgi:hypothetical protein
MRGGLLGALIAAWSLIAAAAAAAPSGIVIQPPLPGAPNGTLVVAPGGSNSPSCSAAQPCATIDYAVSIAPAGATIFAYGSYTLTTPNLALSKSVTINGPTQAGGLVIAAAAGAADTLVLQAANKGTIELSNLTLVSGTGAALGIGVASGQSIVLDHVIRQVAAGARSIQSVVENSFNLEDDFGTDTGAGLGPQITQFDAGNLVFNSPTNNQVATAEPTSADADFCQILCFFADGPGSAYIPASGGNPAANTATITINNPNYPVTAPLQTGTAVILQGVHIAGASAYLNGGLYQQTSATNDTATEGAPLFVTGSLTNPVRVANVIVNGVKLNSALQFGGNMAPKIGFEAFPETWRGWSTGQTGTSLTLSYTEPDYSSCASGTGNCPNFPNNIPASGAEMLPDASLVLPETLTYVSGTPGGLGTYTGSVSQTFNNLAVRIVSPTSSVQATASSAATTVTISAIKGTSNSQAMAQYEQVSFGPFSGMAAGAILNGRNNPVAERIVSCAPPSGGTIVCTADASQTIPAGPVFISAFGMIDTCEILNSYSNEAVENPLHPVEGGFGFVGFERGCILEGDGAYGGQYGFNMKDAPGVVLRSDEWKGGYRPTQFGALYASPGYIMDHVTLSSPYSTAIAGIVFSNCSDWSQDDCPYSNQGTRSALVTYVPEINGGLGYGTGATDNYGPGTPNYGPFLYVDRDLFCLSGACAGTPDYMQRGNSNQGNLAYTLSGAPATEYFYVFETSASSWNNSTHTWSAPTTVQSSLLSVAQSPTGGNDPSAQFADPVLFGFSPNVTTTAVDGSNLMIQPQATSVAIASCPPPLVASNDYYGYPWPTAGGTSCGAAAFQGGGGFPGSLTPLKGSATLAGASTGIEYYLGVNVPTTSLVTTETSITTTAPATGNITGGYIQFTSKPGYDTSTGLVDLVGYGLAYFYDNGAFMGSCIVPAQFNSCTPPTFPVVAGDRLSIGVGVSSSSSSFVALTNGRLAPVNTTLLLQVNGAPPGTVNESANHAFIGPCSGSPTLPTFRVLCSADLPTATATAAGAIKSPAAPTSGDVVTYGASGALADGGNLLSAYLTSTTAAATYLPLGGGTLTGSLNVSAGVAPTPVVGQMIVSGGISMPPFGASGEAALIASSSSGFTAGGYGSVRDFTIINAATAIAAWVPTGTTNFSVGTGGSFLVSGTSVLSATTLGSGVVNSSLTSVGALTSLAVTGQITAGKFLRPGTVLFANLGTVDASPQVGDMLNITDASACTVGTQITVGGGSTHSCPAVYNGVGWFPQATH